MDAVTLPLGSTLSPEARTWWGWQDGVSHAAGEDERELSNGFQFVPPLPRKQSTPRDSAPVA